MMFFFHPNSDGNSNSKKERKESHLRLTGESQGMGAKLRIVHKKCIMHKNGNGPKLINIIKLMLRNHN